MMMIGMRRISLLCILLLVGCTTAPATAFTADSLEMVVQADGDTEVSFHYTLSWLEHIAVFLRIADPADELKNALEGHSNKTVEVTGVTSGSAAFLVYEFTAVRETPESVTYTTPEINFTEAETILQEYWFAPLITTDLSPAVTTVTFPDGSAERFEDRIEIPHVTREIPR